MINRNNDNYTSRSGYHTNSIINFGINNETLLSKSSGQVNENESTTFSIDSKHIVEDIYNTIFNSLERNKSAFLSQNTSVNVKNSEEVIKRNIELIIINEIDKAISNNAVRERRQILEENVANFETLINNFVGEKDDLVLQIQKKFLTILGKYGYDILGELIQKLVILSVKQTRKLIVYAQSLMIFDSEDLQTYSIVILNLLLSHRNNEVVQMGFELFEQWETPEIIRFLKQNRFAEDWMKDYVDGLVID